MLTIRGEGLTIANIAEVADGQKVCLADDAATTGRIQRSCEVIDRAIDTERPVYGVTTCFGGMADQVLPAAQAAQLQRNLLWSHKAAIGDRLPKRDVRAAMLLRASSLVQGISGVRLELLRRFEAFLNADVTPHVYEFGSIGASGDLVPLSYIGGALIGLDAQYRVDFGEVEVDALTALQRLGLEPLALRPKEGLALINGTSVTAAVAANCVKRAQDLLALSLGTHALFLQALQASNQSFHPFIHAHKPHPGQRFAAAHMLALLEGSKLVFDELDGRRAHQAGHLLQDRYSVRCLPQFMGPIIDGLAQIARQVEIEANSVTDNPLIDAEHDAIYHCGNFLAQYIGVGMDQLRYHIGLCAKHLDVQIALLVAPQFNRGLAPSLVGNTERGFNVGLKALQLTANSLMPMLGFLGNSIADRFPTHAEQFNQNINSLGLGAANLARRSLDVFEQYMAVALLFGVQSVDLRSHAVTGSYDARAGLSPATASLYEAVKRVAGRPPAHDRPFVWNDDELFLDVHLRRVHADLAGGGVIRACLADLGAGIAAHAG